MICPAHQFFNCGAAPSNRRFECGLPEFSPSVRLNEKAPNGRFEMCGSGINYSPGKAWLSHLIEKMSTNVRFNAVPYFLMIWGHLSGPSFYLIIHCNFLRGAIVKVYKSSECAIKIRLLTTYLKSNLTRW